MATGMMSMANFSGQRAAALGNSIAFNFDPLVQSNACAVLMWTVGDVHNKVIPA